MNDRFGSETSFRELKAAWDACDRERMAELMLSYLQAEKWYVCHREEFSWCTLTNKEDAFHDAIPYVLGKMEQFLQDPANDPDSPSGKQYSPSQKRRWLRTALLNGMRHTLDKERIRRMDSLDQPATSGEDQRTLGELQPSAIGLPEKKVLLRETLNEACRDFFSQPNSPDTLLTIGFIILHGALHPGEKKLEAYAAYFNGRTVGEMLLRVQRLIVSFQMDETVLAPLKSRMTPDMIRKPIEGITARKLANRKNSILQTMRDLKQERGGSDPPSEGRMHL